MGASFRCTALAGRSTTGRSRSIGASGSCPRAASASTIAAGGTQLYYTSRYDAGGTLKPFLVRRFQKEGIATSLEELRAAVAGR
jgi:hypothetical protein